MYRILFIANITTEIASLADIALIRTLHLNFRINVIAYSSNAATDDLEKEGIAISYIPFKGKNDRNAKARLGKHLANNVYDLVQATTSATIATTAAVLPKGPILVGYRGAFGHYWYDVFNYLGNFHPRVDAIWCISQGVAKHVKSNLILSKKNVFTIYKGIEDGWFKDRKRLTAPLPDGEGIIIGTIANFRKVKGLEYLIKAINLLPSSMKFHLLVIGQLPDDKKLENLIANPEIKNKVSFLGYRQDSFAILRTIEIYVQPSLKEGLGKSIMEAMLAECAIIVTDSGGPAELIEDGKSGFVVATGSELALAKKIKRLIIDKNERELLQQEAKNRIYTSFSSIDFGKKMVAKYKELIEETTK